ncbi:MAG: hypothetical protein K2I70_04460, partial [Bacilli bacterium]|nr:hypothetical protein [Bacilli bacterium]
SNIVFIEAKPDNDSVASITSDGKTINFVARELKTLGDEVTLDFVVKNKSRQYDAEAVINCDYTDKLNGYNEYTNIGINPSKFTLLAQEKQNGKLTIRLIKSFIGTDDSDSMDVSFSCTIVANAIEREDLANEVIEPLNVDAFNYITDLAENNSLELAYDGTGDNNLRYIGENPHNYVKFNDELWRIIGLMNNISDEYGNKGSYLKIIRNESIGDYAWDIKAKGNSSEYTNSWLNSTLMNTLNEGAYWKRSSGICAKNMQSGNQFTIECDFSSSGLMNDSKNLISKVNWHLGSLLEGVSSNTVLNAYNFYVGERSENTSSDHPSEWVGYIGLMYPSDLAFSAYGVNREACLQKNITLNTEMECYTSSWLNTGEKEWALTPSTYASNVHFISYYVGGSYAGASYKIRPVVFLYQNVKIMGGFGTEEEPYLLA